MAGSAFFGQPIPTSTLPPISPPPSTGRDCLLALQRGYGDRSPTAARHVPPLCAAADQPVLPGDVRVLLGRGVQRGGRGGGDRGSRREPQESSLKKKNATVTGGVFFSAALGLFFRARDGVVKKRVYVLSLLLERPVGAVSVTLSPSGRPPCGVLVPTPTAVCR